MMKNRLFLGVFGRRLFFMMAGLGVILMGAVGLINYELTRRSILHSAEEHLLGVARNRSAHLQMWLDERKNEATQITELPEVKELTERLVSSGKKSRADSISLVRILSVYSQTNEAYGICGILDTSGNPLVSTGDLEMEGCGTCYSEISSTALKSDQPQMGQIKLMNSGQSVLHITRTIAMENGRAIAVLIFAIHPQNTLNRILADYTGLGETGETYLIGADTLMLTPSRHQHHPPELTHKMPTFGVLKCLAGVDSVSIYPGYMGGKVLGAYIGMPEYRWVLMAEMQLQEAFKPLRRILTNTIIIMGIGLTLVLITAMLIARQFAYPLVRLIEASNAVANGNLEVQIGSLSRDEVGDLTQRFNYMVRALKKSHSEAEHSHQQLLQAERLAVVGQLVASIVHEMRNPLSAIKMNLQILERKSDLSPSFTEHILIAREQVNRLERMLYELLEYSKPVIPTFYPMELRPLVEKFKYEKREQMQLKKISYRVELPSVPVVIKSDADILTRILDNLISNSINAYDEGGEIIVRVLDGEAIKIEMEDFGRGMSTKTLSRLFEPFFTTREDGVGLGMCNVKKFCEALNIKLEVQSELGKGTKVIVTVPKGLSNG